MSDILDVAAADGMGIDLDGACTLAYNGDATLDYVEVVSGGNTYRQTYSYGGGAVTAISGWVKQ